MTESPRCAFTPEQQQRLGIAKKRLIHVANWSIMDEKHRKVEQIKDCLDFLRKICENVREQPEEEKFRRIRVANKAFSMHVRDAPGGEEFMHEAGWRVQVIDHEKYWVFEAQPKSLEWAILEEACTELDKLWQLAEDKIQRKHADRRSEQQQQLEAIRKQIEDDKHERHLQFRYGSSGEQ